MPAPVITTIAGTGAYGYNGDPNPATYATLYLPFGTAVDSSGNVFIADSYNSRIREIVKATGYLTTVAGTGSPYYNGEGAAIYANIGHPDGVAVDASGNLFIADSWNNRIREVVKATGNIITIAGNGSSGYSGDGGPATSAMMNSPFAVAVDGSGNVFFSDQGNNRVREIVKATGTIITVAGTGSASYNGDNIPATSAMLNMPNGVAVDGSGNLFISDWHNNRIREVVKATGNIITIAGTGTAGFSGDGGLATSAMVNYTGGVAVDGSGNVFIADSSNERIREVFKATGIITTVAGNGTASFGGDGGSPTSAAMNLPYGVAVDSSGNFFIADSNNQRIREVSGISSPVLGNLSSSAWTVNKTGFSGTIPVTGGTAPYSNLTATGLPAGLTAALSGSTVTLSGTPTATGTFNNINISVQDSTGATASHTYTITINALPLLGTLSLTQGSVGVSYPGVISISGGTAAFTITAQANLPTGLTATVTGTTITFAGTPTTAGTFNNVQLSLRDAAGGTASGVYSITIVPPAPGTILALAGSGTQGYGGDGGPAPSGSLYQPYGVAVDGSGNIFIADFYNSRVREVVKATGNIITVAGTGIAGFSGDGGAATAAQLYYPTSVAVDSSGNLFIVDAYNGRIREVVKATGIITTVAGSSAITYSGDGGPATSAGFSAAWGVAVDASGNLYITDTYADRVREVVKATGIITTIAGTGTLGYSGDGGSATAANLNSPYGVAVDASGNVYIADYGNHRIREVVQATGIITTFAGNGTFGFSGDGGAATAAQLDYPESLSLDPSGNLFIADTNNQRIREVVKATGDIVTVAGNGTAGYGGDGGPATSAMLKNAFGVAVDATDNVFIADTYNNRIREVLWNSATTLGTLSPSAWTVNQSGFSGAIVVTGGTAPYGNLTATGLPPGISAAVNGNSILLSGTPTATGTFSSINVSVADLNGATASRTYAITINGAPTIGALSSTQGSVGAGYTGTIPVGGGTGTLVVSAQANLPPGLTATLTGNTLTMSGTPTTAGTFNNVQLTVRDASGATASGTYTITISPPMPGSIITFAGSSSYGYGGDGGPPSAALLDYPYGVAVDASGNIFIADSFNNRIREVVKATGNIITVAGTGTPGFSGDGGAATSARLNDPTSVAVDSSGNLFIADASNYRIREVVKATGIIITFAGNGSTTDSNDGGYPLAAGIASPWGVAVDGSGNVFIADYSTNRIREVQKATGTIFTIAGNGTAGFTGDGGYAGNAELSGPRGVAVDASGNLYIADSFNNRIREVVKATGNIITVAGNGNFGYSGDGGSATSAQLYSPQAVAVDASGNVFIADSSNHRIRMVVQGSGIITTIAGNGATGSSGDGGPATSATLSSVYGLAVDATDDVFIADTLNSRVREVLPILAPVLGALSPTQWTVNQNGYVGNISITGGAPPSGSFLTTTGLPPGLTASGITTTTGSPPAVGSITITGTPTAAGTYSATLTIRGMSGAPLASHTYSFTINAAPALGTLSQTQWTVGQTGYPGAILTSGGTGALTVSAESNLPPGLTATIVGSLVTFTGTPTTTGTYSNIQLTVQDTTGATSTGTFSLTINPAPTLGVLSTTAWTASQPGFSSTVSIFGGTGPITTLSASGLPSGLSATLSGNTITISGTPTTAGTYNNVHLSLQDSTGATANGTFSIIIAGPAVTLSLTNSPTAMTAGASGSFTVTALDALGNVAIGYRGTVSLGSSDPLTGSPTTYTFTAADSGVHTFTFTLDTAGSEQLYASDPAGINGFSAPISVSPAALDHFAVAAPHDADSYYGFNVTVSAEDAFNNTILGYNGTVHFSSSDSAATLPDDYTYTPTDQGSHTFSATLQTTGMQTVAVNDSNNAAATGTASVQDLDSVPGLHFVVNPSVTTTTAGTAFDVTLTALDLYNNVAVHYDGTVSFSSTDQGAGVMLPADYTFTAADAGVHTFSNGVTLVTAGNQSLSTVDTSTVSTGGSGFSSASIAVNPAEASVLTITGLPATVTRGATQSFTVTSQDAYGNTATSYSGTLHFTSSDDQAILPPDTALNAGIGTFQVVFASLGTQSLTIADTANSALTATQTSISVTPAPAALLAVTSYPSSSTAGATAAFSVTALDAYGYVATGYTGTVHFTSSDPQAVLPADVTLTNGTGTFSATLETAGAQSLTATDTANASLNGTEGSIHVAPAAATTVTLAGFPTSITAGVSGTATLTAWDAYGNVATGYTSTVHVTSSDPQAILPADYTFTAADAGVQTLSVTLKTAGIQGLTVQDVQNGFTRTVSGIAVTAAAASGFTVGGFPSSTTAGVTNSFTVRAYDLYGNPVTGYTGTVHFTSSDAAAVLPADYTFTAADAGVHTFSASLVTAGSQSLGIQDAQNNLTMTQNAISVAPAAANRLVATAYFTSTSAGVVENIAIAAEDPYGNVATTYTGTVHVSSSDSRASVPADYTFTAADAGVHTFAIVLKTAGAQTVSFQDAPHSFTATASIAVTAAAANRFVLSGFPSATTAGVAESLTLTALDAYGNVASGYTGAVHFSSSDPQAVLPANYSFSSSDNGVHIFSASLRTAGTQSLTATDTATSTLTASQTGISVVAGVVSKFSVSGYPATTAGTSHSFTVTATDAFGNVVTGYRGTVHFTSSDAQAGLPANYTFTASDNGVHTFSATLKTAGSQSLTVTDTVTSSITGGQAGIVVTAAAATHLAITAPTTASIGNATTMTVTALDAYGNIATGYLGTVRFTSNDSKAILPSNHTFVAADAGVFTFTVIFKSSGTETLTATDTHTGSIKGTASVKVS